VAQTEELSGVTLAERIAQAETAGDKWTALVEHDNGRQEIHTWNQIWRTGRGDQRAGRRVERVALAPPFHNYLLTQVPFQCDDAAGDTVDLIYDCPAA